MPAIRSSPNTTHLPAALRLTIDSNYLPFKTSTRRPSTRTQSCPITSKPRGCRLNIHPTLRKAVHADRTHTERRNATAGIPKLPAEYLRPSQPTTSIDPRVRNPSPTVVPPLPAAPHTSRSPSLALISTPLPDILHRLPTPPTQDDIRRMQMLRTDNVRLRLIMTRQSIKIEKLQYRLSQLAKLLPEGSEEDPITLT